MVRECRNHSFFMVLRHHEALSSFESRSSVHGAEPVRCRATSWSSSTVKWQESQSRGRWGPEKLSWTPWLLQIPYWKVTLWTEWLTSKGQNEKFTSARFVNRVFFSYERLLRRSQLIELTSWNQRVEKEKTSRAIAPWRRRYKIGILLRSTRRI